MTSILETYAEVFRNGRDLDGGKAEVFLDALINENDRTLLAEVFHAWNDKGIAEGEIFAIARVMRDRCTKVATRHQIFLDIVGTGGSRGKTFNVSTAAAFVVAGAGLPVAKHGNKAATSKTGSADVLSALGVEPSVDAATAARCLDDIGICFMFAPNFHRLSRTLAEVRRGLGFPTIFNCVGPLCNPADAPHRLIGVWSREMVEKVANALALLGTCRSWIVHGNDGLDEIAIHGSTFIAEVDGGSVRTFELDPSAWGMKSQSVDGTCVRSAAESAALIRDVLNGVASSRAAESIVVLNAAAGLYLSRAVESLEHGATRALESIRGGHATRKLEQLAEAVTR